MTAIFRPLVLDCNQATVSYDLDRLINISRSKTSDRSRRPFDRGKSTHSCEVSLPDPYIIVCLWLANRSSRAAVLRKNLAPITPRYRGVDDRIFDLSTTSLRKIKPDKTVLRMLFVCGIVLVIVNILTYGYNITRYYYYRSS